VTMILRRVASILYAFVLMNWAAVAGLYHFVRGNQVWR